MNTILFDQLKEKTINKAFIDAITMDRFALEVVIEQQCYQVLNDKNQPFYSHSLASLKQQLATLNINNIFLHETISFLPNLGLSPKATEDIPLDKNLTPKQEG